MVDDLAAKSQRPSWWPSCQTSEVSCPSPSQELFNACYVGVHSGGLTSRIHTHSGIEGFYVVDGQQCLETPTRIYKMSKGESLVIPGGLTMRLVATGTKPRRALAIIVYDSSQPPTTRMEMNLFRNSLHVTKVSTNATIRCITGQLLSNHS